VYYFGNRKITSDTFEEVMAESHDIAVDIETKSLKDPTIVGIGIAPNPDEAFYFVDGEFHHAYQYIQDPDYHKIYHNCMFDLYELDNPDTNSIGDTAFLARLSGYPAELSKLSTILKMKGLTHNYTFSMKEVMEVFNAKTTEGMPQERVAEKCALDCKSTLDAHNALYPTLDLASKEAYHLDCKMVSPLLKASKRGILLDPEKVEALVNEYEGKVDHYLNLCQQLGCKNPGSSQQVARALAKQGSLFPKKVGGDWKYDTSKDNLKYKANLLAQAVVLYRGANYFLTHYARPLVGKERQYSRFHLDASTSRMSSYDMNLMNIPKGSARECFLPDSGVMTCADASQMQLRILAYLSEDPVMISVFDNNGDIHQETADHFGMERSATIKSVNFGMIFGGTDETLMETANITDRKVAAELRRKWGQKYKRAWEWIQYQQDVGLRDGYVYTAFGRKLYIPMDKGRGHARRCSVNFPIQGTEAEVVKRWILACSHLDLMLVVHDEMLFDGQVELPDGLDKLCPWVQPINITIQERWS